MSGLGEIMQLEQTVERLESRCAELEAENAALRAALPDAEKLREIAMWFDAYAKIMGLAENSYTAAADLRAMADAIERLKP